MVVAGAAVGGFFQSDGAARIFVWLIAGIVVHDLVALPLYSVVDRLLSRRPASAPGPARFALLRGHVRVPALLSALLLLVFFPLISRASRTDYSDASSLSPDPYLHRWLIATVVMFALSAGLLALRLVAGWLSRRA
jgi:hypothetical protein